MLHSNANSALHYTAKQTLPYTTQRCQICPILHSTTKSALYYTAKQKFCPMLHSKANSALYYTALPNLP